MAAAPHSRPDCWQCSAPGGQLFCEACGALQPPPANYFELFSQPEHLAVNVDELQRQFYDLSRKLHPDRYGRKPPQERQYAEQGASVLNDAWRTLRDPVLRAGYVLSQHGLAAGADKSKNVPPELLEEVFELNMALEELRGGDPSVRPQLEAARARFEGMLDETRAELEREFAHYDVTHEHTALEAIRAILNRRRYIENLAAEVQKELEASALPN